MRFCFLRVPPPLCSFPFPFLFGDTDVAFIFSNLGDFLPFGDFEDDELDELDECFLLACAPTPLTKGDKRNRGESDLCEPLACFFSCFCSSSNSSISFGDSDMEEMEEMDEIDELDELGFFAFPALYDCDL